MAESLNWLFFGAGAIGTYIGGSLALHTKAGNSNHRVIFLERPEVAAQIKVNGLRLNLGGNEHFLPDPIVCDNLDEALAHGPFDTAIFALKSYDTRSALKGFEPYLDKLPPFLCLQNGVENEKALTEILGPNMVIAGTVTSAVGRRGNGDIILERHRGMGVAAGHAMSAKIARALSEAGLNAKVFARAEDMKWSKMLTNLLANATSAILDMPPIEIFNHPTAYQLEVASQREALQVMRGFGYRVVDLPGTPVKMLSFGMKYLPVNLSQPLMKKFAGKGRGDKMPSFHIDLYAGRRQSEVEYLNGAVSRFGMQLGIPTPVNKLLNDVLMNLVRGDIERDMYAHQPEKLLARACG